MRSYLFRRLNVIKLSKENYDWFKRYYKNTRRIKNAKSVKKQIYYNFVFLANYFLLYYNFNTKSVNKSNGEKYNIA